MTIIAGVVTNRYIFVGTDSAVSWSRTFVRPREDGKFLELPTNKVIIAWSGEYKFASVLQNILQDEKNAHLLQIEMQKDVEDLAALLLANVQEQNIGSSAENSFPDHEMGFVVASSLAPKLWTIESSYEVNEYSNYVSAGSGFDKAECAFYALEQAKVFGRKALEIAIETACERDPYCGGDVYIRKVRITA